MLIDRLRLHYTYLKQFFTHDIWKYDSLEHEGERWNTPILWMKTFLLACRIIWRRDMMSMHVPALTFATLMAIVPLFALLFVIARGFGYDLLLENWVESVFKAQPAVADTLVEFVHNYLENTQSHYIIGVGLVMMFYTLYSLMQKIEMVFNEIWDAKERKLSQIVTEYTSLFLFFGIMIMVSSFFNVSAVTIVNGFDKYLGLGDTAADLFRWISVIPMSIFFIFLYCAVPNTYVRLKTTIIPGLAAGILMVILQYYYFLVQVWISSYNIVYGSFAALPLFLLWLELSWGICIFGAVLSYANQNLHHYDSDIHYYRLSQKSKVYVCTVIMSLVCNQFRNGKEALTARDIQRERKIPQQIINKAIKNLISARLLVELKSGERGAREEMSRLHPVERVSHLTYGVLLERLSDCGEHINIKDIQHIAGEDTTLLNEEIVSFIEKTKHIKLYDL